MSTYYDKAYRLTDTVKNPRYDKRHKYGTEAREKVEKGEIVFVFNGRSCFHSIYDRRGNIVASDREFGEAILKNVEPYEPVEWRDKLVFRFGGDFPLSEIINKLVETGKVTPDQIVEAAKLADAEADL